MAVLALPLTGWLSWVSHFPSLNLSVPIRKMGIMIMPHHLMGIRQEPEGQVCSMQHMAHEQLLRCCSSM